MVKTFCSLKRFLSVSGEAEKAASAVLKKLKKENNAVEIFLVKNSEIKRLNFSYRGKNKATNILSFCAKKDFPRPDLKKNFLGEIYLAPDYLKRNKDDVKLLTIHGVLHLLGFDHKTEKEAKIMEKKEAELLKSI